MRVKLSNGRRLVDDVIRTATRMPIAGISGDFDIREVAQLRRQVRPRIAWNVIYMKAYAQVSREIPELMQGYATFPWAHLHQHHEPVCMMTISREHEGKERLFFARFCRPDHFSLTELQEQFDRYRKHPILEIKQFRHQIRFAATPGLVRRFAWWSLFNVWPEKRASHMGTFGMSISGHNGVYGNRHLGPNTTTLGVDPFPRNGLGRVLLTFDHRVLDGAPASRVLVRLQHMMNTSIARELREMIQQKSSLDEAGRAAA